MSCDDPDCGCQERPPDWFIRTDCLHMVSDAMTAEWREPEHMLLAAEMLFKYITAGEIPNGKDVFAGAKETYAN